MHTRYTLNVYYRRVYQLTDRQIAREFTFDLISNHNPHCFTVINVNSRSLSVQTSAQTYRVYICRLISKKIAQKINSGSFSFFLFLFSFFFMFSEAKRVYKYDVSD